MWTAIFQRMKWKYGQRAYRYVYLDAGHIVENLALAATSLELGSCQIGALFDDKVNQIIDVDGFFLGKMTIQHGAQNHLFQQTEVQNQMA